ncbi:GNAT family N-acetyltransferase [Vibrio mimicus]|uniref:GNAT family N-acetyltransferase n=1 Tax=Vibrio mimicus TaxID=674 RepID=UPI002F9226FB
MPLTLLTLQDETAFAEFFQDFQRNDPINCDFYRQGDENFADYVQLLDDNAHGQNLPCGYVPCSHFWYQDEHGKILGALRLRHHIDTPFLTQEAGHIGYDVTPSARKQGIGTEMLRLGLIEAKRLGLKRVLLVADEDNRGSRLVIERNGGVLESIISGDFYPNLLARYWIDLKE